MERAKCKSCGADILYTRTEANGYLIQLDADPDPAGSVILRDGKAVILGKTLFDQPTTEPTFYRLHHETCAKGKK